jgi:hypothetical protein
MTANPTGRSLAGIVGSFPSGGMDGFLLWVFCCQTQISATGLSPVQRSPTECGASEYDGEAAIMRRPWPTRGYWPMRGGAFKKKKAVRTRGERTQIRDMSSLFVFTISFFIPAWLWCCSIALLSSFLCTLSLSRNLTFTRYNSWSCHRMKEAALLVETPHCVVVQPERWICVVFSITRGSL